ncbi:MAG: TolC family protein, partial [Candidatus Omnitrophota bacterium]
EMSRKNDPLYKLTGLQIQEKEFEKKMLRSERWPTVNLAAKWDLDRDVYVHTDRVMAGVSGKWNIWDFGRLGAQIHAKEHEIEEKKWEGVIEVRDHENEIRKHFHEIRATREKVRLAETLVREREELFKNGKAKSVVGERGASELMDSFVALEEARTQHLEAVTECRILFAKLGRKIAFGGIETEFQGTVGEETE